MVRDLSTLQQSSVQLLTTHHGSRIPDRGQRIPTSVFAYSSPGPCTRSQCSLSRKSGHDSFHFLPESARVILFPEMHQLVKNHIVADGRRHLNQAIVQRDPSGPRAGTPSRPLISNRERRYGELVGGGKLEQPFAQFRSCPVAQIRFNARSNGSL